MTMKRGFRQEAVDKKRLTRVELEAAAAKHGVTIGPSMSDQHIAEAVCERLAPGAFTFAGRDTDTYAMHAAKLMIEQAGQVGQEAEAAKVAAATRPAPAPASAVPKVALNGTGAIHADAAGSRLVSSKEARDAMIRRSVQ